MNPITILVASLFFFTIALTLAVWVYNQYEQVAHIDDAGDGEGLA